MRSTTLILSFLHLPMEERAVSPLKSFLTSVPIFNKVAVIRVWERRQGQQDSYSLPLLAQPVKESEGR